MSHKCKPMVRNSHNWAERVWVGLYEESEYAAKMVDKVAPWSKWAGGVRLAKWDLVGCVSMWWYI